MIHLVSRTQGLCKALTRGIHAYAQRVLGNSLICEVSVYVVEITIVIFGVMLLYLECIRLNLY